MNQQQQNRCFKWTAAEATRGRGSNALKWRQICTLDYVDVKTHTNCSAWTEAIKLMQWISRIKLTLKAPITTATADKSCNIFPNFQKNKVWYFMRIVCQQTILTKYHALFVIFEKKRKIWNCRLLKIIGGALWVTILWWKNKKWPSKQS